MLTTLFFIYQPPETSVEIKMAFEKKKRIVSPLKKRKLIQTLEGLEKVKM